MVEFNKLVLISRRGRYKKERNRIGEWLNNEWVRFNVEKRYK